MGNGASMPVTHQARTFIPTATHPLHLNDVLISPSLIKNLISVHRLTRDNNVSIEFDPVGFSIKDLRTRAEMLRCESMGDLYLANGKKGGLNVGDRVQRSKCGSVGTLCP